MTFDAGGPAARLAMARRCQAVVVRSPLPFSIRRFATHSSCPAASHSCTNGSNGGGFVWATCVVLKDCSRGTRSGTQKAANGVQFQSLHLVPWYAQAVSVGLGQHPHSSRMVFLARFLGPVCVCDKQHAPYNNRKHALWCGRGANSPSRSYLARRGSSCPARSALRSQAAVRSFA